LVKEKVLSKNGLMNHLLQNKNYIVQINGVGAELCSFQAKESNLEYVWQGNSEFWGSTAPVLFPIIGALKTGKYTHEGADFSVPKHGFIRNNENLVVKNKSNNTITFYYASSPELKKDYPFDFGFEITFSLCQNVLEVSHEIRNVGNSEMLFSLGGHPAFNCPLLPDENYNDYYLEFDAEQSLSTTVLAKNGLLTDETFEVLSNSSRLELTEDLFANDALIFKNIASKKVALKSNNHAHSVTVTYPDFINLGVWAKHKAPFVCIEPWLGVTDHENATGILKEKEGIISLAAGEKYNAKFSIEIN
jgi:galactose mutarotase-like enzyme